MRVIHLVHFSFVKPPVINWKFDALNIIIIYPTRAYNFFEKILESNIDEILIPRWEREQTIWLCLSSLIPCSHREGLAPVSLGPDETTPTIKSIREEGKQHQLQEN